MTDYILQRFIEPERWTEALRKGVDKGMCMADLQMLTRTDVRTQMLRLIYDDAYCMHHIVSTEQGITLEDADAWFDHQSCELNDGHYFTSMYL